MIRKDLKKELKKYYTASTKKVDILTVPPANFVMVDGKGDPNTAISFQEAVGTLYSISYTLKFKYKKEKSIDYPVMALEGLWWADDMNSFGKGDKDSWLWTVMIMQPEFVSEREVLETIKMVKEKSKFTRFPDVRFEKFDEGLCGQILHLGPYSSEGPTIKRLHDFVREKGYTFDGKKQKHHEIYLSDPRRCAPEKIKTIIRQPIRKNV